MSMTLILRKLLFKIPIVVVLIIVVNYYINRSNLNDSVVFGYILIFGVPAVLLALLFVATLLSIILYSSNKKDSIFFKISIGLIEVITIIFVFFFISLFL